MPTRYRLLRNIQRRLADPWAHLRPVPRLAPVGLTCDPGEPIYMVKHYVYVVQPGEYPAAITTKWGIETGGQGRPWKWPELRRANADDKFVLNEHGVCVWMEWRAGKKLRIPANWPEPPSHMMVNTEPYDPSYFG